MPTRPATVAIIITTALALAWFVAQDRVDPENRPLPPQVHKLRAVRHALFKHHEITGTFPHDARGFRHALYKLHVDVPASAFQLYEHSENPPPKFDHSSQQLVGGDLVYLNYPLKELVPERLVMFAIGKSDRTWVLTSTGTPTIRSFPIPPDASILGSFITLDNFLVTNRETYDEWTMTHFAPFSVQGDSKQTTRTQGPVHSNHFSYTDSRLTSCSIKSQHGTVTEDVTTDPLGQIVSLSRSPSNAEDLIERLWADIAREAR